MLIQYRIIVVTFFFIVSYLPLAGCSSFSTTQSDVHFQLENGFGLSVRSACLKQKRGIIMVSGYVSRISGYDKFGYYSVEATVIDNKGKILEFAGTDYIAALKRMHYNVGFFHVPLSILPPPGSTVRISLNYFKAPLPSN